MSNINKGVVEGLRRISGQFRDLVIEGGLPGAPLPFRLRGATPSLAPAVGTWRAGDTVLDRNGYLWLCTANGTPGSWVTPGILMTPTVQTGTYTAKPGDYVLADTTSASFTVTMPSAPPDKTLVGVKIYKQPGINTVTIQRGGSDTFDDTAGTSRTLTLLFHSYVFQYSAALGSWVTVSGNLQLGQLDSRYGNAPQLLLCEPTGTTAVTFPRALATTATGAMTSGTLYVTQIPLFAGTVVNNLTLATKSTALTGLAHGWYVLLDSGLVVRAVTADQTTGSWLSVTNTAYTLAATAPYNVVNTGAFYIGVMANATGMPVMAAAGTMTAGLASAAPVYCGSSSTGQTTPPTTGTTMGALTAAASFTMYGYTS